MTPKTEIGHSVKFRGKITNRHRLYMTVITIHFRYETVP